MNIIVDLTISLCGSHAELRTWWNIISECDLQTSAAHATLSFCECVTGVCVFSDTVVCVAASTLVSLSSLYGTTVWTTQGRHSNDLYTTGIIATTLQLGQPQPDPKVAVSVGQDSLGEIEGGEQYNPLVQVWPVVRVCSCVFYHIYIHTHTRIQDFLLKLPGINSKNYRYTYSECVYTQLTIFPPHHTLTDV